MAANSIAVLQRYLTKAIDEVFVKESRTEILENGSKFIDLNFKEAGYVKIYSILMDGLSWYYRANSAGTPDAMAGSGVPTATAPGSRNTAGYAAYAPEYGDADRDRDGFQRGSVEGGWEIFQLRYYRAKQFRVDQMDDEETAGLIIGNLLTQFIRTKVVPEVDVVRFGRLIEATNGGVGNLVEESLDYGDLIQANGLSSQSILAKFNKAFVWLNKHEVPDDDQVIFVSEDVWGLLLGDPLLTRFFDVSKQKSESGIDWEVQTYMGRPIIHVPDARFFTNPVLGNNGYYAGADSRKINYIVSDKRAIVPVVKLDYTKIWTPDTVQNFIGYKVNFAMYHDAFIPRNKKIGVYASVAPTTGADSNILSIATSPLTAASTAVKALDYVTVPNGLMGKLYYSNAASNPFVMGANDGIVSDHSFVVGADLPLATTAGYRTYVALVANGVTIAMGDTHVEGLTATAGGSAVTKTLPRTPVFVESSDAGKATASFSGTTLTVTPVAAGKTVVTVVYADGEVFKYFVTVS